jgi:two-component system phosphate regulon sensor histidine kinase PhoR
MKGRRLFGQFLLIELGAIAAIALIVFALISSRGRTLREAHAVSALEGQALVVRAELEGWLSEHPGADSRKFFDGMASHVPVVFTLYARNGEVLASSAGETPAGNPPLAEIEGAVSRRRGVAIRAGKDGEPFVCVAVPVGDPRGHVEVVYATAPLNSFEFPPVLGLGPGLVLVALAALLAGTTAKIVANVVARPVGLLREGADRMRAGGAIERLPVPQGRELGQLAESLNEMTAAWEVRLQTALRQRNEQEAVLSSMVEGVLAVDNRQNVISINHAAANIVGIEQAHAQGQALDEIVRNSALQEFVSRALTAAEPLKEEIVLHQRGRRQIIEAHGARLRGPAGAGIGAVVVLNDVTELRRLEQVRRDFVSNVSHELKTPVTSIKGFVETLLDGALDDPAQARRFLEIVQRQADRLNAIIEDLLTLSRLEQRDQAADEMLETAPLIGPLREAVELCAPAASARGIRIDLSCDPGVRARINTNLIQQGVVNLIDNAVKYSENNTSVSVEAIEAADEVLIFVRDQGCGIAADHLPRLFERFYRVDQARSRNLGGTGLGLSIVRHIVQSHRGRVTVESTPGIGSSFCIHLPKPVAAAASVVA